MLAKINPKPLSGTVPAISSKSMAHLIIIAAALENGVTRVACDAAPDKISSRRPSPTA